jgi:hypothetical protein
VWEPQKDLKSDTVSGSHRRTTDIDFLRGGHTCILYDSAHSFLVVFIFDPPTPGILVPDRAATSGAAWEIANMGLEVIELAARELVVAVATEECILETFLLFPLPFLESSSLSPLPFLPL